MTLEFINELKINLVTPIMFVNGELEKNLSGLSKHFVCLYKKLWLFCVFEREKLRDILDKSDTH